MKVSLAECASMTLDQLLFSTFDEIKLNVPIDSSTTIGTRNTEKSTPLLIRSKDVSNNLIISHVLGSIEHLDLFAFVRDVDVVDRCCGNYGQDVGIGPFPIDDVFSELDVL